MELTDKEQNDLVIKRELKKIHKRNKETLEFVVDVYMSQCDISEYNALRMEIILKQQSRIEEYLKEAIRY